MSKNESQKSPKKKAAPAQNGDKPKNIRITLPDDRRVTVPAGTQACDILEDNNVEAAWTTVAAEFKNKIIPLRRQIFESGKLEPVHLGNSDGMLIARRTLTFILTVAIQELFPRTCVYINHSVDGGYYCEMYRDCDPENSVVILTAKDLRRIDEKMREIIDADLKISRDNLPAAKAIARFAKAGKNDKVELFRYTDSENISVYKLKDEINHFYGILSPTTGRVSAFEVVARESGFVLRFARSSKPDEVPPPQPSDKILTVLKEYENWMKILEWRTVPQFNQLIDEGRAREYVLIAEALQENKIAGIAEKIVNHPRKPKVVLLAGPSASGKTTSVKRLGIQLRVNGYRPVLVGLDDFFVSREETPKDEFGDYDFESFHTVNIALLQDCINRLLNGETVQMPRFDFIKGHSVPGHTLKMEKNSILIIEGIHGLNDNLLPAIPDGLTFKIYASPLTHLNIDDHNRISSADCRLLRRIVRDHQFRGYTAVDTISRWPSVRRGEEKNIFPYQENADVIFNSSLPYELAPLKKLAVPVLAKVSRKLPEHKEAARLLKFLSYFREVDPEMVPRHSLLREFIGGSCFDY